ncbi:hypothetical protein N665_0704s0002 [Sinapis alba]|nr:hypothetical protein N665_0704s0002 [Sinapis alba]
MYDIKTVQVKNEDRKRVIFRLRDTNGNDMECCLRRKYAKHIESHLAENEGQTIICLIRFSKISNYKVYCIIRNMQITNAFDASLVTLNPSVQEALDFKQRMLQVELPLAIVQNKLEHKATKQHAEDWDDVKVSSISEILVAVEIGVGFSLDMTAAIIALPGSAEMILKGLHKIKKPLFRCEFCRTNVTNVSPKYKLHVYVANDNDSCKIMLLNSVGKTVIGKNVVELWNGSYNEIEDPKDLPELIQNLVGKSFCFGISISSDNVTNGAYTYLVSEVRAVSLIETGSSTFSGGEFRFLVFDPNSPEDVTTPFSKRKDFGGLPDITSTSKKLWTTTVKLEKSKTE